ncbi:hypothetical protein BU17DRAFT_72341 [Hysterangium stoloniferum]|nr:hypothetical protein BU17DRAFT_72341 [Hysterangium stoloniferum]
MCLLPVDTARMCESVSHISSSQQFRHEIPGVDQMASPWFQASVQQLRADIIADVRAMIVPELRRVCLKYCICSLQKMNQSRGDGRVKAYAIVPFTNGDDPTQLPHNLPCVSSVDDIDDLNGITL